MADYKRMVSYMYQYDNGVKKKNVGFARVEAKSGQCKITLHMQLLGQLDSIFPTYLILRNNENIELIYVGDTTLKNQVMDSKLTFDADNVMESGHPLSEMGGILLFLHDNVFFATEWEDRPIIAKEVLDALKPKAKGSGEPDTVKSTNHKAEAEKIDNPSERVTIETKIGAELKADLLDEMNVPKYKLPRGWKTIERLQDPYQKEKNKQLGDVFEASVMKNNREEQDMAEAVISGNVISESEVSENEASESKVSESKIPDNITQQSSDDVSNGITSGLSDNINFTEKNLEDNYDTRSEDNTYNFNELENSSIVKTEKLESYFEDIIQEDNKEEQEKEENIPECAPEDEKDTASLDSPVAESIFQKYPRIYPFEDNEILLCVKIEPKDIGLLPKELWPMSNNSFLLHGYYCYHHLIFAKKKEACGSSYLLGVPGIYHNREQFMARMFGMDSFKSIRKRDLKMGDFGYWYLPVNF